MRPAVQLDTTLFDQIRGAALAAGGSRAPADELAEFRFGARQEALDAFGRHRADGGQR